METPVSEVQRSPMPQSTTEVLKEIANLEIEVKHLERHLLSLYRKVFDHQLASLSTDTKVNSLQMRQDDDIPLRISHEADKDFEQQRVVDSSINHRSHSSLSQHSAYTIQSSPLIGKVPDAVYSYHSMPLKLYERPTGEGSNSVISLGDYLSDHKSSQGATDQTANWISEELIRCISAIYCELAAHSNVNHDYASPTAFSLTSSISGSPLAESANLWSPLSRINSSLDLRSDAPFYAGGYGEFSGPYSQMVEVLHIYRDNPKLKEIEPMLQKFRSLVKKLEGINASSLKHEEKLAFWINVHNALVMHVAYNVGGRTVSVGMIQKYILGRQLPHPGQWFHRLFHLRTRFRTGDKRKWFEIDRPEPLSYFALCCGCHSDPPVRVYTPRTVFQDLIAARGDYLLSNYRVQKEDNKIMLPKIVDNYVKDSGLHPADFWGIIEQILPADPQTNKTFRYQQHRKSRKKGIGWIPHNFSFRYQFPKDLFE